MTTQIQQHRRRVDVDGMYYYPDEAIVHPTLLNPSMAIDHLWKQQMRNAKATINFPHNSAKYERETVLGVYSRVYPKIERRGKNNDYARNEIAFPLNSATRDFAGEWYYEVDARLKGVKT